MTAKPVIPRALANVDVDSAIDHYFIEGGQQVALDFIGALERALTHIADRPATGSPPYAHELNLPGLRAWGVTRFPYLVFYVEYGDHIDVWRVLHQSRDISAWMREPVEP